MVAGFVVSVSRCAHAATTITRMATAPRVQKSDPLTQAMRTSGGESVERESGKAKAQAMVDEAREGMPAGVPENSALHAMNRDRLLGEANRVGITLGVFMEEADLRLVLAYEDSVMEHQHVASTPQHAAPRGPMPPVPASPPNKFKVKGIEESPINAWRATNKDPITVHFKGQAFLVRHRAVIELRHYGEAGVQAIANAGVPLKALETLDDE